LRWEFSRTGTNNLDDSGEVRLNMAIQPGEGYNPPLHAQLGIRRIPSAFRCRQLAMFTNRGDE
jgi:hypothetical protein